MRRLGAKHGYFPTDPDTLYLIDWCLETGVDLWTNFYHPFMAEEAPTEEIIAERVTRMTKYCSQLESVLAGHGKTYLAGERITIADFHALTIFTALIYNKAAKHQSLADAM